MIRCLMSACFIILFSTSITHAISDEYTSNNICEPIPCVSLFDSHNQYPHKISVGLEGFELFLKTKVKDVHIKTEKWFTGLLLAYEYLKPNAFYAAFKLFMDASNGAPQAKLHGKKLDYQKDDMWFGGSELRLGYCLADNQWNNIPFLGIGSYSLLPLFHDHHGYRERLPYLVAGIRSIYEYRCNLFLGLNLKIMHTFQAQHTFYFAQGDKISHDFSAWGAEVSLPFLFSGFESTNRWQLECEPYFLRLPSQGSQNIYGLRLVAAYLF